MQSMEPRILNHTQASSASFLSLEDDIKIQHRVYNIESRLGVLSKSKLTDKLPEKSQCFNQNQVTRAILSLKKQQSFQRSRRYRQESNPFQNIRRQISSVQQQFKRKADQIQSIQHLRSTVQQLTRRLEVSEKERNKCQNGLERVQRAYELQRSQIQNFWLQKTQELNLLHERKLQNIQQNLKLTVQEVNKKTMAIAQLERSQRELQVNINQLTDSYQAKLRKFQFSCQNFSQENKHLQRRLLESDSQVMDLQSRILKLQQELRQNQLQSAGKREQTIQLARQNQGLKKSISKLQYFCSQQYVNGLVSKKLDKLVLEADYFRLSEKKFQLSQTYGYKAYEFISQIIKAKEEFQRKFELSQRKCTRLVKKCTQYIRQTQSTALFLLQTWQVLSRFTKQNLPTTIALMRDEFQQKRYRFMQLLRKSQQDKSNPQIFKEGDSERVLVQIKDFRRQNNQPVPESLQQRRKTPMKEKQIRMVGSEQKYGKKNQKVQKQNDMLLTLLCLQAYAIEERFLQNLI